MYYLTYMDMRRKQRKNSSGDCKHIVYILIISLLLGLLKSESISTAR